MKVGKMKPSVLNSSKKDLDRRKHGHEEPWENDMSDFQLTQDSDFMCCIGFFIESSPTYSGIIEMFNQEAQHDKRWEIKVISRDYIRKTVLDNCTKSRDKKPFNLLCDQILRYYHNIKNISTHIPDDSRNLVGRNLPLQHMTKP